MGTDQHREALGALSLETRNPLLPAFLAQIAGLAAVGLPTLLLYPDLLRHGLLLAMLQGGIAAIVAHRLASPPWWLAIHLAFLPLVVLARSLELPGWVWPAGLALLLLTFWRTDRSRVPLYLSSRYAATALSGLLPPHAVRMVDLGCGDGALLRHLARQRPDCRFVGIEHAPLPWLWSRIAALPIANLKILYGDFWGHPLGEYDLVFAFLSPAPMPELWEKARSELRPEGILVSSTFAVPGQAEALRVAVNDSAMTYFYVYRPA